MLSRSRIRKRIFCSAKKRAEVASLLGDPASVGVAGTAGEVDAPCAVLDEEEHIEAAQKDALYGEEVTRDNARGLLVQKLVPARTCLSRRGMQSSLCE